MAAPQDKGPMDVLQQTINDVLVQTGKALKAVRSQGPRNVDQVRNILSTRMNDSLETYHYALDDIEIAILDAKAVLMRDLELVQARKASAQQAEQHAPIQLQSQPSQQKITPQLQPQAQAEAQAKQAAKAAVSQHMTQQPPQKHQFPPPPSRQFQLQQPPAPRNNSVSVQQSPINRPVAPVPDMGVDVPTPPKTKTSPLATKKDLKGAGAGGKGGAKPSPRMNSAKPGTKASPNVKKSAPAPSPAPVSAPAPAPAPAPPAVMTATAPVPVMDLTQSNDQFNLPANNTAANAGLNFTDMEFTVAQGSDGQNQAPPQGMSLDMPPAHMETIDLDSFFDAPLPTGNQPAAAPTAPMSTGPAKTAQQAPMSHDDIYDLGSATTDSMDLDFALGQGGGGGFIDDLFIDSGDGALGGLEDSNNMFT